MPILNIDLPMFIEIQSHLSFHSELSISTIWGILPSIYSTIFLSYKTNLYLHLQTELQLSFIQLLLEFSAKRVWKSAAALKDYQDRGSRWSKLS